MKKSLSLLLAFLLVFLCACTKSPEQSDAFGQSSSETREEESREMAETTQAVDLEKPVKPVKILVDPAPILTDISKIWIGENDVRLYRIVCGKNAGDAVKNAAQKVQAFLASVLGEEPELIFDYAVGLEGEYEIVIGRTNRTKSFADAISPDDYWVKTTDTRLILGGGSDTGTVAATERFLRGYLGSVENGVYTVSEENRIFRSEGRSDPILSFLEQNALSYRKEAGVQKLIAGLNSAKETDSDVYGGYSFATLCLPAGTLSASQLVKANRIVRNTMAYPMEDGGRPELLTNGYENTTVGHPFAAIRLVRLLYSDQSLLEEQTREEMKTYFLTANYCSKYNSENLILMFRVARYLAACHFENETFLQYGLTAEEARKEDHDAIVEYLQYRASHGWAEFDSTWYNIEDFGFMLNLYDLAPDEDLRKLAEMTMDVFLLGMITDCTENNLSGGAHRRVYATAAYSVEEGMAHLLSLYFGREDNASPTDGAVLHSAPFAFLSGYHPGEILYEIEEGKEYPFSNYERTFNMTYDYFADWYAQENGYVNKYTYNTSSYSIGCVNQQDDYPSNSPDKAQRNFQQTNWSLVFADNPRATVFTSHPGCEFEDKTLGKKSDHDFWFGDGRCDCQEFFGNESTVIGIYNIDISKQQYTYIHAHIEEFLFDRVIWATEENAIYMKLGDAYAALRFTSKYTRSKTRLEEILIRRIGSGNTRIGFVCEAGDQATYGSFEAFVEAMRAKPLVFDKEALSLTYDGLSLYATASGQKRVWHRTVNGQEQYFPYANTYESPYMTSVYGSGVIEMKSRYSIRTLDFYNITDTVR